MTFLTFDLDDLDLSKNEPLNDTPGFILHPPTKLGEDRHKDLGGEGEQRNTQTNKQTDKLSSNYSMIHHVVHIVRHTSSIIMVCVMTLMSSSSWFTSIPLRISALTYLPKASRSVVNNGATPMEH